MNLQVRNTISIDVRFLGKLKAKLRDFLLKVNNIISLWRSVIPNQNVNLETFIEVATIIFRSS